MNAPWTRNKTLILIVIVLSLIATYFISSLYVIHPLKIKAANVENEVNVYQAQIDKLTNQENNDQDDEDLNKILLQIPENKSSDHVLATLQKVSNETKVTIDSIKSIELEHENEEEPSYLTRHSYSLDITADKLDQVNAFLDGMLVADRLMTITILQINQSRTEAAASITFTTYYINH